MYLNTISFTSVDVLSTVLIKESENIYISTLVDILFVVSTKYKGLDTEFIYIFTTLVDIFFLQFQQICLFVREQYLS